MQADELKSFLLKLTDAKNFPYHLLNEQYRAFFKMGQNYLAVSKQELKELYAEQNKLTKNMEIKNFRILSRSESEFYTTVTYEYDWSAKIGKTNMNGIVSAHSILQNTATGWTVVFDAVSQ